MLTYTMTYTTLKDKAREFLAATGLTTEEFDYLLPAFAIAHHDCPPQLPTIRSTQPTKRQQASRASVALEAAAKAPCTPWKTSCCLSWPTRRPIPCKPCRGVNAHKMQPSNGKRDHYSGKKKAHTDKNLLLVNEHTGKVAYLGPTIAGKTHDKKAAAEAQLS
jgi:hypothetical protein